jgi:hypothetical protein
MRMYLLDTDHLTLLDRGSEEGERLRVRLASVPAADAALGLRLPPTHAAQPNGEADHG